MKTQQPLLKKRPKSGVPITVKTLKGGCRYFSVTVGNVRGEDKLFILGTFTVQGRPCRNRKLYDFWRVRATGKYVNNGHIYLGDYGISPLMKHTLSRTFRYTEKVWNFYKDLVDRQDREAYKEAIAGTI